MNEQGENTTDLIKKNKNVINNFMLIKSKTFS